MGTKSYACYWVMHSGDGPLKFECDIDAKSPDEAAEQAAMRRWRNDGVDEESIEHADHQWIAVAIRGATELFRVFKVSCRVKREFVTCRVGETFNRQEIDDMKLHPTTKFQYV